MSNDFLTQILANVLGGGAGGGRPDSASGGLGGMGGLGGIGGLGGMLGSVLGSNDDNYRGQSQGSGGGGGGASGALIGMLLPLAMQWVQSNGGLGGVLDKFRQQGHGQQVASWVGTGENQPIGDKAVQDVVGLDEISRMSQKLGVSQQEVTSGFAQILPEVVNHLTPNGAVPDNADEVLGSGIEQLSRLTGRLG